MERKNIVLILGAGASIPYGFPSGRNLIFEIANNFGRNANSDAKRILIKAGFSEEFLNTFCRDLIQSNLSSVDAFLEQRESEYKQVGKMAIAATLIPHESPDGLVRKQGKQEWYEYLYNLLGTNRNEFPKFHLSVITFNYDRSLEYFLFNSLKFSHGMDDKEASNFLSSIPIVHVYGQLGKPHYIDPNGRPYSTELTLDTIEKSANELTIIHEGNSDSPAIERARDFIAHTDVLCFLGFGYHETNVQRLGIRELFKRRKIYGSAYGLGKAEINQIKKLFFRGWVIELGGVREGALEFLREHVVFGDT